MITNKYILPLTFMLLIVANIECAFAQDPIVYSRCARTTDNFEISAQVKIGDTPQQASRLMKGLDIYDVLPDVTNFFGDFSAPCDLMYRNSSGEEHILYNCSATSTDEESCAALDAAVSFNGRTIAFSVFRGSLYQHNLKIDHRIIADNATQDYTERVNLPNKKLKTTGAHLHTIDVATGMLSVKPFEQGIYDSGPTYLANGRIAFTSNRDKNTTTVVWRTTGSQDGTRIWSIDPTWKNLALASHHSLSQEQHPYLLKNGRLAYSSWQILGSQPFSHTNGSVGGFSTLGNMFHIYMQNPDGANNFPLYGQHSGDHNPSYFGEDHNAAHFIAQTSDERVWFADYYRRNNNGLGILVGVMAEPDGQEGISPTEALVKADIFVPTDVINFASWATNGDGVSKSLSSPSISHPSYTDELVFSGKVGHPAALTNNNLLLTWGKGPCSTLASSRIFRDLGIAVPSHVSGSGTGVAMNMMTHLNLDTPGCDAGLYQATQIPSQHPSDLALIVDSPNWHEIMAKAVVPYQQIHNIEMPIDIPNANEQTNHPMLEKGTPFGLLGAASITDRETHPKDGISFAGESQFNLQGTDTINYNDEDLCGIRILSVMPNRSKNTVYDISNLFGERVGILGEFSVQNKNSSGSEIIDASGNPDTSFLVRFPANVPYLMQGIDCKGRTLNTDMTWQHLRPGEKKVCGGCHVHSKPTRITFEQSHASTPAYNIPLLGEGLVTLLTGKSDNKVNVKEVPGYAISIDFSRDILPIFEERCNSCHGGDSPAAELALDRPGDHNNRDQTPSTWWCLVGDVSQDCISASNRFNTEAGRDNYSFRRPQVTRYIRAFNALGSLLYWKAANQRTDRNENDSFTNDLDFGADHPTAITPDELGLLSRWIDLGSPGGPKELLDTQKPTLHLSPSIQDDNLTALKIGTVDIGSGIDPSSLNVCILDTTEQCNNIANEAQKSGVTTLEFNEALNDPTTEMLISVKDMAGNKTEVRRTIGYLTNGNNSNISITPINDATLIDDETLNFSIEITDNNITENTITVLSGAGTITKVDDNNFTLVPPENYQGEIFVIVSVTDNSNASDSDSIAFTVEVKQINDAPVSVSASIETLMDTQSIENIIVINDPDLHDSHVITITEEPNNGIANINGHLLSYQPNKGFFGNDSFIITATDTGGLSITGTVNVSVLEVKEDKEVIKETNSSSGGTVNLHLIIWLSLILIIKTSLREINHP